MAELTKALIKALRFCVNNVSTFPAIRENVREEIADVEIMLEQMEMLFEKTKNEPTALAYHSVNWWRTYKLERLQEKIKTMIKKEAEETE